MPIGMGVGLGTGDIVLDGDPAPPPHGKGHSSPWLLCSNGWMDQDTSCVRWGPRAQQPPTFRPMSIVAKRSPQQLLSCCLCTVGS